MMSKYNVEYDFLLFFFVVVRGMIGNDLEVWEQD